MGEGMSRRSVLDGSEISKRAGRRRFPTLPLLSALCASLCALCVPALAQDWATEPYLGVRVRDSGGSVVVGWIMPGPLGGRGFDSEAGLQRGDVLVAAHRGAAPAPEARVEIESAATFEEFVKSLAVGETVTLEARRAPDADPGAAVPQPGTGDGAELATYSVQVASRGAWSGTIGRGLGARTIEAPPEGAFEAMVLDVAGKLGALDAEGALGALLPYLADLQNENLDPNSLPAVVSAFRRPLSLDAQTSQLRALAAAAGEGGVAEVLTLLHEVLDIPRIDHADVEQMRAVHEQVRDVRARWFADAPRRASLKSLVRTLRDSVYIMDERAPEHIDVIQAAGADAETMLTWHLERLPWSLEEIERVLGARAGAAPIPAADLPTQVRAAVTGDVLHYELRGGGAISVVGGPGPNEYDMGALAWVYDAGGDDVYRFRQLPDDAEDTERIIIDVSGDDRYESTDDFAGPAVGVMGNAVIDDRAGNDVYSTTGQFSIGAGLMGVGLLIDRAGDDRYENLGAGAGWSMGAGFYGAGLVLDLEGDDTYHGETLCQGVGGPRGLGAIIDAAGADTYTANGPNFPSVYGTEGVFKSFSQGFGYGVRSYAAGGLGALWDLAGADRYEAGEFSQGCAYYFALGLLHDLSGDDEYIGNRYSQAAAAHQSIGALVDDAGNDAYWAMTAASQSGAWDQSVTFLLDRAGDDTYEADGLAQGSAAQQALAVFLDLEGDDRYAAKGGAVHGQSSADEYHWAADRLFSFSAFFDLGGADTYSSGRENGASQRTGARNDEQPERSTLHGVFVDR